VTGCRWPALGPVQRQGPHHRPVDLALESTGHPAVAQDADHLALLGPGRLNWSSRRAPTTTKPTEPRKRRPKRLWLRRKQLTTTNSRFIAWPPLGIRQAWTLVRWRTSETKTASSFATHSRSWTCSGTGTTHHHRRRSYRGKAPGPDDVPVEAWKLLVGRVARCLRRSSTASSATKKPNPFGQPAPRWKNKGDVADCANYRPIRLLCCATPWNCSNAWLTPDRLRQGLFKRYRLKNHQ